MIRGIEFGFAHLYTNVVFVDNCRTSESPRPCSETYDWIYLISDDNGYYPISEISPI